MLEKIETQEIMTAREAMVKYETKFFIMIITEKVDGCDNDLGYVLFTADTKRELAKTPKEEYFHLNFALMLGGAAEPYPSVGSIVYYDD